MIENIMSCLGGLLMIVVVIYSYRILISVMYDWAGYNWDKNNWDNDETA